MYRSFVTCDDPKGVVECGTIRKSKADSQKMDDKIKSQKTHKNSSTSMAYNAKKEEMVPRGVVEEYHSPSSFQLLEVSRGAQKLNHLIDSWSKGLSYDGQSKDIAKELLKGALDLQDSLTMLGKLQEASQYMAQLKKKQKEKSESRIDGVGSERTNSHRSADQNHQLEFQKPRHSADGSSRDCIEELRDAIRDSLARQNLLPNTPIQKKKHFDGRRMDLILDIPSTSTSQSSAAQSNDIHCTSSSKSQTVLQKKGSPNLIAKLMGLEDIPSKPPMQPPEKQLDMEKNLSQRRAVFDIERPKLRKPHPIMQKVSSERRTLKELLETVHFQGLLKDGSAKEFKSQSHQSSDFYSKERLINEIPPIVLIKPLRVPCLESEEVLSPVVWEKRALNTKNMLKKLKIKEGFAPRSIDDREGTSNASEMHCKTEADEIPIERVILEEGVKDQIEVVVIPEEKEVRIIDQKEEASTVKKVHKKLEAEKAPLKRIGHEERKKFKGAVSRAEEKEIKKKLNDSSKMKGCSPVTHQQQGKEMTDKKVDKIQKVAANSQKPAERETVKTKNVSRNQDQAKMTSAKLRKPEKGSITTNDHISLQRSTTRKNNSKLTTQTTAHNSKDRKQNDKQATEHITAQPITDNLECKENEKRIDLTCGSHSVADQLSMEEKANASKFQTEEHCGDNQSSICIASMRTSEFEKNPKCFEEADDQMTCIKSYGTSFKNGSQLKILLLSNPSFLNLADELFHLNISYANFFPKSGICDSPVADIKLSTDYANEFIERRSLLDSRTRHPLLSFPGNSRIHLSLDQLVEEVCTGVETLRSYYQLTWENLHSDSLYAILEREMKCKGLVSGTWDLGWKNGFTVEEIEQAVNDLERLILSELIGEVFL